MTSSGNGTLPLAAAPRAKGWVGLIAAALVLLGWLPAAAAKPWKSAEVITQQRYRYGAVEARIRAAQGSGLISAVFFWRPGSEANLDQWQEQDFEIFGKDGRYQTQVMTPGRTQHVVNLGLPTPAWERYYTYRMEWTPEYLAFYVDGELVRMETDQEEYQKLLDPSQAEAAEIRLSLWGMDIEWSGELDESAIPTAAFFDYCAYYAYTPGQGPGGSDFTQQWRDDFNWLNTSRWWFANWTWDVATDYVPQNAAAIDGKLVLAITSEDDIGNFPDVIPQDEPGGGECAAGSTRYEAEALDASAGGVQGSVHNLWSNGTLSGSHDFNGGPARLSVVARGEAAQGQWPHAIVRVGGAVVADFYVDSAGFETYDVDFEVSAGSQSFSIEFDNDYYEPGLADRNLLIDAIDMDDCR